MLTEAKGRRWVAGKMGFFRKSTIEKAVQRHGARNRKLLKVIAGQGVDPAASRAIDIHFWAFSEAAAQNLSAALEANGYSPVALNAAAEDPSVWNVETTIEASPLSVAAPFFVEKLVRLASEHNSEFDGWGTSI